MSDQNKGPCFGVPAKDEHVSLDNHLDAVGAYLRAFSACLALSAAIDRGGYDVSPCLICQELTVSGGIAMCKKCAEKAGGK